MKELIIFILENSLPEGAMVSVAQKEDEQGVTFELTIPEEYRGRVIGKGGSNIKALRNVVNILARRDNNQRVYLKIVD